MSEPSHQLVSEAIEKQREIESILSGQLTDEDEEDVLKELEGLAEDAIMVSDEIPELPNVPTDNLVSKKTEEATNNVRASKTRVALEAS